MQDRYHPQAIEARVQQRWRDMDAFRVTEDRAREKFYCLSMLPYPSGRLHMGHVRNYTIGDVIARFQRMQGRNVLQPMGWDAFGLPAENAAIKHGVPPAEWTYENITHMRGQLQRLGFAYDWSREITTCKPEYYRWEQLFFTRLFKQGLVYQAKATVNWDPVDQTVLANEQVVDGKGWRSGAPVERREIPQWFLKITDYADELLEALDRLAGWPEAVKTMQRNWIGRSEGLAFPFQIQDHAPVRVFTTRPDTLYGATYLAVAPEHPLALQAAEGNSELGAFLEQCQRVQTSEAALETLEKRGMDLGIKAIHPLSGEILPVWVANFVLMGYGSGAIMAVPAHDQRDWEFATKYGLPIQPVIAPTPDHIPPFPKGRGGSEARTSSPPFPKGGSGSEASAGGITPPDVSQRAFTDHGVLINSGDYTGLTSDQAFDALAAHFEQQGAGQREVHYRLRDWGVSRQRYWGCPIPMIHCGVCGPVPVPEDELPVVLPEEVRFMGVKSPLKADPEWRRTTCPQCGGQAERETDTFDTFVESSWYYARYCCPDADAMLDERADYWLPVDQYIGGIEHAVMHLLYFRFWHKLMRDAELVHNDEPATNLLCQGMVLAESYYRDDPETGREWIAPAEVHVERDDKGQAVSAIWARDGEPVTAAGWTTMSKSRNNGIDPQGLMEQYGADTVRLFAMFAAPPEQALEWSDAGVEGAYRFLNRLWRQVHAHLRTGQPPALKVNDLNTDQRAMRQKTHATIAKVSDDIGRRYTFNTAVAAIMELSNSVSRFTDPSAQGAALRQEAYEAMTKMLSPVCPHIAQALWEALGHQSELIDQPWPEADADAMQRTTLTVAVQVNGKLRGTLEVAPGIAKAELENLALAEPNVARFVAGKAVRKVIVVPDKLVNIVAV